MDKILEQVRKELIANADEKTKASGQRFFKEPIVSFGVKAHTAKKISKASFKLLSGKTKEEIFELCEKLWQTGYIEESFVACEWSYYLCKEYKPADFEVFARWINLYVSNWASCDTICNHTVGEFIMKYPGFINRLKEFAKSDNRWVRRAAAVSLILPARKGMFLTDIFEIAEILLLDEDDLVQKGYGWMLKVASQSHQQEVFDFIMKHKAVMPRTALRYAIEKMPEGMRRRVISKR